MNVEEIVKFIRMADKGMVSNTTMREKVDELNNEHKKIEQKIEDISNEIKNSPEGNNNELQQNKKILKKLSDQILSYINDLLIDLEENKHFNKRICFRNIRELIRRNPEVKIGRIENEANLRVGYMSRLEKDSNMSEPSLEFVVTAAKLLDVSIDTLLMVDMTSLTEDEKHLSKFFNRIKLDTLAGAIKWNREKASTLNSLEVSLDKNNNPLFTLGEEPMIDEESGCPEIIMKPKFISHNFDKFTRIYGDCFDFQMEDGMRVYLMNIEKLMYGGDLKKEFAKEIWMWSCKAGKQYILSNKDESPLADEVDRIFNIVDERTNRPVISDEVHSSIDRFINRERGDAL